MSSLVAFPFKTENPEVVVRNLRTAAAHPRVGEVVAVGVERESTWEAVEAAAPQIATDTGTPVGLVMQERIGTRRPGKGDGMNTALRMFLDTPHDRLHFYDSDITSFDETWITKEGRDTVNRAEGIACLGGAALDTEECYLLVKAMRSLGTPWIEHQARI